MKESLLNKTRLKNFLIFSVFLHVVGLSVQEMFPESSSSPPKKPPIKVKYIQPEKPLKDTREGTIIDAPKPKKIEKPKTKELLASADSRAHSNLKKTAVKKYQRKKTIVPKSHGKAAKNRQAMPLAKAKAQVSKTQKVSSQKKKPLPFSQHAKFKARTVEELPKPKTAQNAGTGSVLAFLDGFDAKKYASLDTQPKEPENFDDEEEISLDTTETKYASYFARIKHQIERVWNYPLEAARRGIAGELTLRFRISKDGNLIGVQLTDKSGYEVLDFAAIKAVKEAAPFYPFPVTIKKEKLSIRATFIYTPTFNAQPTR